MYNIIDKKNKYLMAIILTVCTGLEMSLNYKFTRWYFLSVFICIVINIIIESKFSRLTYLIPACLEMFFLIRLCSIGKVAFLPVVEYVFLISFFILLALRCFVDKKSIKVLIYVCIVAYATTIICQYCYLYFVMGSVFAYGKKWLLKKMIQYTGVFAIYSFALPINNKKKSIKD